MNDREVTNTVPTRNRNLSVEFEAVNVISAVVIIFRICSFNFTNALRTHIHFFTRDYFRITFWDVAIFKEGEAKISIGCEENTMN